MQQACARPAVADCQRLTDTCANSHGHGELREQQAVGRGADVQRAPGGGGPGRGPEGAQALPVVRHLPPHHKTHRQLDCLQNKALRRVTGRAQCGAGSALWRMGRRVCCRGMSCSSLRALRGATWLAVAERRRRCVTSAGLAPWAVRRGEGGARRSETTGREPVRARVRRSVSAARPAGACVPVCAPCGGTSLWCSAGGRAAPGAAPGTAPSRR
jgi:hypothetical protein